MTTGVFEPMDVAARFSTDIRIAIGRGRLRPPHEGAPRGSRPGKPAAGRLETQLGNDPSHRPPAPRARNVRRPPAAPTRNVRARSDRGAPEPPSRGRARSRGALPRSV